MRALCMDLSGISRGDILCGFEWDFEGVHFMWRTMDFFRILRGDML